MRKGIPKAAGLAIVLALAAVTFGACGSSGDDTTTPPEPPPVSAATADHLAKLSDRIASDLDAGDTCHAAHAADDLSAAVQDSDLPANLKPGVRSVATDLVNQVNCPPPPPPPPPPEPEKKPKEQDDQHGKRNGNEQGNGHSAHGGFVPPGQAKLKGESG